MTGSSLFILLCGAAGFFLAALFYLREEVSVSGRSVLLTLRIAALALVVLLLLDLTLPGGGEGSEGAGDRWVLLDSDLGLLATNAEDATLWEDASTRAAGEVASGARIALATPGTQGPEGVDTASLRLRLPGHPPGDLIEGAARLGEVGADSILILSAFRQSPELLERLAAESLVPLRLERVEGVTRNVGIGDLDLPNRSPDGEPLEGLLTLFGEGGGPGDSVQVEVRADGEAVSVVRLPVPEPGVELSAPLLLPPPSTSGGAIRYSVHVDWEGDAFPIDDARARWVEVGEPEGGISLISLRPDWEPRTLLPVLEAVTGLDAEGYLSLGGDRFLTTAQGNAPTRIVAPEDFRETILRSRLLVLHGAGAGMADWVREVARSHPRIVHLPYDTAGTALAGVGTNNRWEAEWNVESELPVSPVSPFFTGIPLAGLPPLTMALPAIGTPPGFVVLAGRSVQSRESMALFLLREVPDARLAVALGEGYWRWGTRDGVAREAYRALWGGVADWLLAGQDRIAGSSVAPVRWVTPRGAPIEWEVGAEAEGPEIVLLPLPLGPEGQWQAEPAPGATPTFRGVLEPNEEGRARTVSQPPGLYRFEARGSNAGPDEPLLASGMVEVESWAPSLRLPPLDVGDGTIAAAPAMNRAGARGGRPLRTSPLPYLLILILLVTEWVGRRRMALR